jgi:hypothetical protein
VSHSEIAFQEMKLEAGLTLVVQGLLRDEMRETLAGRLPFLDGSSDISRKARAETQLEGSNLWMYVTRPSDDAADAPRQFWILAGRVLVCDDTADLAAYLNVALDGHLLGCSQQGCALELAANAEHGTPVPKAALFLLGNQRLAGQVESITFRYHADVALDSEAPVWELIALSDTSFSRDACPFYGERTWWGRSPDSLQRCDCKELFFWC